MKFYNIEEAAEQLSMRQEGALALCQSGWFGRKVSNIWLITDKEIKAHLAGKRVAPGKQPTFYDADAMIRELKISRSRFYRLVAAGTIKKHWFGNRGGSPNFIFTEDQLKAARTAINGKAGSGTRPVESDKHIEEREDGRHYILGTLTEDPGGVERNYKSLTIARAKAREAFGQEPTYRKGDSFPYGRLEITVLKDVTPIDGLAHIRIGDVEVLWPVRQLIAYEESLHEKELVTVYKDGLWPPGTGKGESDDTDKETRQE